VPAGATVSIENLHSGLRSYLAVHDRLQVPLHLGSCAPDTLLDVGAWLRAGRQAPIDTGYAPFDHPVFGHPLSRLAAPRPRFGSPWTITVTDGPDLPRFGRLEKSLFTAPYLVTPDSDHIGLRLRGPAPICLEELIDGPGVRPDRAPCDGDAGVVAHERAARTGSAAACWRTSPACGGTWPGAEKRWPPSVDGTPSPSDQPSA
jgi:hypothetical protein